MTINIMPRKLLRRHYLIIITSALPMGFLPDSQPHKLMINYGMIKLAPYPKTAK